MGLDEEWRKEEIGILVWLWYIGRERKRGVGTLI